MRGSQEIVHDADIAVNVMDGIATTTKNRFKEKAMELQVFEKPQLTLELKRLGLPRNVI